MKLPEYVLYACLALFLAAPARAESLSFDHRIYPPLKDVLDGGQKDMILYDSSNPRYVIDRIAVRGKSATEWSEALEIVARAHAKGMSSASDWMTELRIKADKLCRNNVTLLTEDAISVTFERSSPACPGERAPFAIYRIVTGKTSLFLLAVLSREPLEEAAKQQWLKLLASAHLQ